MKPEDAPPTPSLAKGPPPLDLSSLARHHETALDTLAKVPYSLEYTTPQEILVILRLCYDYQVDFTQGLEPRGAVGEATATYALEVRDGERIVTQRKACRIRHEVFLEYPQGVWLPDGDTAWAHHILGILRLAIRLKLEACYARK